MDHIRQARLSTGFRRLSLTLGIVAGLGIPTWVISETTPSQLGSYPGVVLGIIVVLSFITTWGLVRLIGWTILGFCGPAGPNGKHITNRVHDEDKGP
jgi:hypothetical protein